MGGTSSKVLYGAVNDAVTQVAMDISNECLVQSKQEQNIDLTNYGWQLFGSDTISQRGTFELSCALQADMITKLQDKIIQNVMQKVSATDESLFKFLGKTKSEAETKIRNSIRASVTSDVINRNMATIDQKQNIPATNYGLQFMWNRNISQDQKTFVNSVVKAVQNSDVMKELETRVIQDGETTSTDGFAMLMNTISSFWYIFLILFVIGFAMMAGLSYMVLRWWTTPSTSAIQN